MSRTGEACETYTQNPGMSIGEAAKAHGLKYHAVRDGLDRRGIKTWLPKGGLKGARAGQWKGGRRPDAKGYIRLLVEDYMPDYVLPMSTQDGYILEHRYVMAKSLGRALYKEETVHHVSGDRSDNRLENLQLRSGLHGKGVRLVCGCCGSNDIRRVEL